MLNTYFIRARLFPTILTAIPLLLLVNYLFSTYYYKSFEKIFEVLPILAGLGLSTAFLFLSVQINRIISKEVFQRIYFKEEINMPTTNQLLWSDNFFDNEIKTKIRAKINVLYGIELMNEHQESSNELASRNKIAMAVSQIRNSLRSNKLLFQHNIEYGFFRNLLGGALLAVVCSINIIIFAFLRNETILLNSGIILLLIYSLPIILSKAIMKRFGHYYSKVLYEQFLTLQL
ncbi:hypothetical protein [Flavobacterium sp.]|uniref:hypothetical protein n=1 Tax=Flavobacterium sp. TaxID=239 RepID=UPI0024885B2E|nr:hypothetical protein [Flavobacterium sp.]MDI1316261.1 hypothetical protein [Flavobacterium sp.]